MRRGLGGILAVLAVVFVVGGSLPPAAVAAAELPRLAQGSTRGLISRDRAADIARAATGGRVLRVELRRDGQPWYRVKVLVNGTRVRIVRIDARSGRVLG